MSSGIAASELEAWNRHKAEAFHLTLTAMLYTCVFIQNIIKICWQMRRIWIKWRGWMTC